MAFAICSCHGDCLRMCTSSVKIENVPGNCYLIPINNHRILVLTLTYILYIYAYMYI